MGGKSQKPLQSNFTDTPNVVIRNRRNFEKKENLFVRVIFFTLTATVEGDNESFLSEVYRSMADLRGAIADT